MEKGFNLFFDYHQNDINDLYETLEKLGDLIYVNEHFSIWLKKEKTRKDLEKALKKAKIGAFVCSPIVKTAIEQAAPSFYKSWAAEHFQAQIEEELTEEHQRALREMSENIKKADAYLDLKIKEAQAKLKTKQQGGAVDGRDQGNEKTERSPEERKGA